MTSGMRTGRWVGLGSLAAIGALALGCSSGSGGIGPGDYAVLRLAESQPSYGTGCNEKPSMNTDDIGVTYYIFAGAKNAYYLDSGGSGTNGGVLTGTSTSTGYSFTGQDSTTTALGDETETQATTTTVTMTVSGDAVTGTATSAVTSSCTGTCAGITATACTTTIQFAGTILQNVQLEQAVPCRRHFKCPV